MFETAVVLLAMAAWVLVVWLLWHTTALVTPRTVMVEAPHVTVQPPNVTVEATTVTVQPPMVTVEAPNVTVEAAQVTVPMPEVHVAAPNVTVQAPAPQILAVESLHPDVPKPVGQKIALQLVDEEGNQVGMVAVDPLRRPSTFTYRVQNVMSQFAASHQVGDRWVYRRIGIERE